jgi:hypothetical protein
MRHWTAEERQRQAELIHSWKPWERSTGPKTLAGKAKSSRNADKLDVTGKRIRDLKIQVQAFAKESKELLKSLQRSRK